MGSLLEAYNRTRSEIHLQRGLLKTASEDVIAKLRRQKKRRQDIQRDSKEFCEGFANAHIIPLIRMLESISGTKPGRIAQKGERFFAVLDDRPRQDDEIKYRFHIAYGSGIEDAEHGAITVVPCGGRLLPYLTIELERPGKMLVRGNFLKAPEDGIELALVDYTDYLPVLYSGINPQQMLEKIASFLALIPGKKIQFQLRAALKKFEEGQSVEMPSAPADL